VLAGGRGGIKGLNLPQVTQKADLPIDGRPMVEHVVSALSGASAIKRVSVARGDGDSLVANLLSAIRTLEVAEDDYVLVSACDIPFLTPEAIDDFLINCEPGFDVYYPIVRREACEHRFPGVKRTYAKFREGTFTGGNLFLVKASVLPPLTDLLERFFRLRKSPLRLAQLFGFGLLGRFFISSVLGTLPIGDVEQRALRLAGIRAKAVISDYAEIGTDIDKLSDMMLVKQRL